jgi:hypothetical protein
MKVDADTSHKKDKNYERYTRKINDVLRNKINKKKNKENENVKQKSSPSHQSLTLDVPDCTPMEFKLKEQEMYLKQGICQISDNEYTALTAMKEDVSANDLRVSNIEAHATNTVNTQMVFYTKEYASMRNMQAAESIAQLNEDRRIQIDGLSPLSSKINTALSNLKKDGKITAGQDIGTTAGVAVAVVGALKALDFI